MLKSCLTNKINWRRLDMFENNDEYSRAIRDSQVHVIEDGRGVNIKLIFINMGLLLTLVALIAFYLQKDSNRQNEAPKIAVLGVSYTSSKPEFSNDELLDILDEVDVDSSDETPKEQNNAHLYDEMTQLLEGTSAEIHSEYKDALVKELK